jgi:hypothetical protein
LNFEFAIDRFRSARFRLFSIQISSTRLAVFLFVCSNMTWQVHRPTGQVRKQCDRFCVDLTSFVPDSTSRKDAHRHFDFYPDNEEEEAAAKKEATRWLWTANQRHRLSINDYRLVEEGAVVEMKVEPENQITRIDAEDWPRIRLFRWVYHEGSVVAAETCIPLIQAIPIDTLRSCERRHVDGNRLNNCRSNIISVEEYKTKKKKKKKNKIIEDKKEQEDEPEPIRQVLTNVRNKAGGIPGIALRTRRSSTRHSWVVLKRKYFSFDPTSLSDRKRQLDAATQYLVSLGHLID